VLRQLIVRFPSYREAQTMDHPGLVVELLLRAG